MKFRAVNLTLDPKAKLAEVEGQLRSEDEDNYYVRDNQGEGVLLPKAVWERVD